MKYANVLRFVLCVTCAYLVIASSNPSFAQDRRFVAQGSDYLSVPSEPAGSTFLDFSRFGDGFGVVPLQGKPNFMREGAGNVSVIIQRQQNTDIDNPIDSVIQIVDLSLQSDPNHPIKNQNGFLYNVTVTLDPAQLPNTTGTISISRNGNFTISDLAIYFLAFFNAVNGGPRISPVVGLRVASTPKVPWINSPDPNMFIIQGVYPDQRANRHIELDSEKMFDFYTPKAYLLKAPLFQLTVVDAAESTDER